MLNILTEVSVLRYAQTVDHTYNIENLNLPHVYNCLDNCGAQLQPSCVLLKLLICPIAPICLISASVAVSRDTGKLVKIVVHLRSTHVAITTRF